MCGIAGIFSFDGRPVEPAEIGAMNARMVHRGPDESGDYFGAGFAMGMRRLSIIDVAGGHQPCANEDETVRVILNGEIYNYRELREELAAAGHRFRTNSDTEVLAHAYEAWGDDFAQRLNGIFGFAVWDENRERLLLGRDRLGVKPLYFAAVGRRLAFASETRALYALDWIPTDVDPIALDEFMTLEYTLAPRTLGSAVRKLEPAHLLIVDRNGFHKRRTWSAVVAPRRLPYVEAAREVERLLGQAVRRQMVSDVPLGAFLSGGVDSSILVSLMAEAANGRLQTFSIGFDDASYNELRYARLVANRYGTRHEEAIFRPDAAGFFDHVTSMMDEPIGDVSLFPTYLVSKLARKSVTVALAGDGGDELFGGYDAYLAHRAARKIARVLPTMSAVGFAALRHLPPTRKKKGLLNRLQRFSAGMELPGALEHYRWMTFLRDRDRQTLYTGSFRDGIRRGSAYHRLLSHFHDGQAFGGGFNRQSYVDLNVYLVEDILAKVDVASMAASLEARVPFLDHDLVEFVLSLPEDHKIKGFTRKRILRDAFRNRLPEPILRRSKEGFSIPLKNWLRTDLRDAMRAVLSRRAVADTGLFEWRAVERLMTEHESGRRNHAHQLWCLLVFHLWRERISKRPSKEAAYALSGS